MMSYLIPFHAWLLLSYERLSFITVSLGLDSVQAAWLPNQDEGKGEHDAPKKKLNKTKNTSVVACSSQGTGFLRS